MFERIRCGVSSASSVLRRLPPAYTLVPALLLALSFIIRFLCGSVGSSCMMCKFAGGIGLFPSPFFYTLGHIARLILCGVILASALFSYRIEKRAAATSFAASLCFMMLFEYKLIFTVCNHFLAALMCLACGACAFISLLYQRGCSKYVSICALLYIVMQSIFFVQTVSLVFCF